MKTDLAPHPRDNEPWVRRVRDDLDKLMVAGGYTIRDKREANLCECGWEGYDADADAYRDWDVKPCGHGCCTVFACPECGHYSIGFGVAGCPCDDGI